MILNHLSTFTKNDEVNNNISVIIPSYNNIKSLSLCLKSALITQDNLNNEYIIFIDNEINKDYENLIIEYNNNKNIKFLSINKHIGFANALNYSVYEASNKWLLFVNDNNIFCKNWDTILFKDISDKLVLSINQIKRNINIYNFVVYDFGDLNNFNLYKFLEEEPKFRKNRLVEGGGLFPFIINKKYYMAINGFDNNFKSQYICSYDFFLRLELINLILLRSNKLLFYHLENISTEDKENENTEDIYSKNEFNDANYFYYKWRFKHTINKNNFSKKPNKKFINGIEF